tara:strand:+ start:549 stop:971 length:423 start_codon:yes stop_codon:yes gene_type:complete
MARDISWLFIAALGAAAFYFALDFNFGSLANVGSAVYPLILSSLLIAISLYSFLFAPREQSRPGNRRAFICVSVAVAVFILLVEVVGLLPTIVLSMTIAYAGQTEGRYGFFMAYALVFAVGVWLLFSYALNMPVPPIRLP